MGTPWVPGFIPTQPYAQTVLLASKQAQELSKIMSGNYLNMKAHILFWQQALGRLSPLLSWYHTHCSSSRSSCPIPLPWSFFSKIALTCIYLDLCEPQVFLNRRFYSETKLASHLGWVASSLPGAIPAPLGSPLSSVGAAATGQLLPLSPHQQMGAWRPELSDRHEPHSHFVM